MAAPSAELTAHDWSTRADLLEEQCRRVEAIEDEAVSLRRTAAWAGWVVLLVLSVPVGLTLREESAGLDLLGPAVAGVLVAAAAIGLLRHHVRSRRVLADLRTWSVVDRVPRWRGLPPGQIDPALLTAHDARDDSRLPEVARDARRRAQERIYQGRVFAVAAVLGLVSPLGLLPLGSFGAADGDPVVIGLAVASSAVGLGAVASGWSTLWQVMRARQRELNRASLEEEVYLARFRVLHGGERPDDLGSVPLAARVVAPTAVVALLGVLAWRVGDASSLALAVSGVVVALVVLVLVLAVLRQRRPHVVSLLAPGGGLLERPDKPVTVGREEGDVVLRGGGETVRLAGHEVVSVERVRLAFALAPPAVLVVTSGDPVVVAGRGVDGLLEARARTT
ncbi:hypothetical protein GCM10009623_08190 [Nocardioides aestuarii]|uniref:Uncharacterized protein n=1 Tax=Nocardioides aestuarii TaxID=252231 RepID=A0ABW4THV6_9ACTN